MPGMRTILLASSAEFVLLSSACEGLGNRPPQRAFLPSNPEAAVGTFLRSLESGHYKAAATLLVDANSKPLDTSAEMLTSRPGTPLGARSLISTSPRSGSSTGAP